jgi:hypothetical protein
MRLSGIAGIGLVVLCVGACSSGESAAAAPTSQPKVALNLDSVFRVDISTPDRALQSYWRNEDLIYQAPERQDTMAADIQFGSRWKATRLGLLTSDALADAQNERSLEERYAREILKVDQETETRAVVLARIRNVAPIPAGAVLSDYERKARQDGGLYRYIFQREAGGWKIAQIQSQGPLDTGWSNLYDATEIYVPTVVSP